jgi:hypothetical protein
MGRITVKSDPAQGGALPGGAGVNYREGAGSAPAGGVPFEYCFSHSVNCMIIW